MESALLKREKKREKRSMRVRSKLKKRFRLSVNRTNKHIFAQIIDDELGKTVVAMGTISKEIAMKKSKDASLKVGALLAEMAKKKLTPEELKEIAFDRGRYKYHGLVAAVAAGARDAGLKI